MRFIAGLNAFVEIVTVQININDINDNPPYFTQQQYNGQVEETAAKGKLVMNVRASDADINNNFQYSLPSGNDNQAFEITNTGEIVVFDTGRLDYETKKVSGLLLISKFSEVEFEYIVTVIVSFVLKSNYHINIKTCDTIIFP